MDNNFSKKNIMSSLFWKLLERGGTQGIQFLVQIILARILTPKDFGTIAIVMVFISIAQVFVQSSFNTSLIQKKNADEVDFSSVFYLSLVVSALLYFLIYTMAPYIASFYADTQLTLILRVLGITLFFGSFNSIQNAFIAKNMLFKKLFISSLGAMLISGFFGILTALNGLGVWALVIQQLINQISITLILMLTVKWRPQLVFSYNRVKLLFSYGWKLLVSSLINVIFMNIRTLIIGRIYSPSMLGFYNRGEQFPKVIVSNVDGSIQSVLLPTLSAHQDNIKKVKEMTRRAIVSSSFIIFPMMIGMAVVAEPLVLIVLTDKWLPVVPFLQIFCFSYALIPIHTANLQAINAVGRSDIFLKLEVLKKIIGFILIGIGMIFGIYALAIGQVISGIISSILNAYPNKKLLNYGYKEQLKDIFPSFLNCLIMGVSIYFISFIDLSPLLTLFFQVFVGSIIYIFLAKIFKVESYTYLVSTIKDFFGKRGSENVR